MDNLKPQLSTYRFFFDIISNSDTYQNKLGTIKKNGWLHDVTDKQFDEVTNPESIKEDDYIKIVQKSSAWLYLRGKAIGTGSSVGKYLPSPVQYPTKTQLIQTWKDKQNHDDFVASHTTAGHMKWGVYNEDVALVTFAEYKKLCVTQVGTIKVPVSYIHDWLVRDYGDDLGEECRKVHPSADDYFLISPDGMVGIPNNNDPENQISSKLTGMLEIKCISPFHNEEKNGYLIWGKNLDKRQWYQLEEIPFVYVIQMCLQSISGIYKFNMKLTDVMYFIRWSPEGFSLFSFKFEDLVPMGLIATELYLCLYHRLTGQHKEQSEKIYPMTSYENLLCKCLHDAYHDLKDHMTHEYQMIKDYPIFNFYHDLTRHWEFRLPEYDPPNEDIEITKNVFESEQIEVGLPRGKCLL